MATTKIRSSSIEDGQVSNADLSATIAVTGGQIADDAVTTAKILDDNVTTAKILDNNVTLAKMAGGTDGNLITYDASGDPAYVATGAATNILTSNGAGAAPTFQAASSASNTPQWFAYNSSATTNVTSATWTAIVFDTEVIDTSPAFASNTFTVPVGGAGTYFIVASVCLGDEHNGNNKWSYARIGKTPSGGAFAAIAESRNSYDIIVTTGHQAWGHYGQLDIQTINVLAEGDAITVEGYSQTVGGTPRYYGGAAALTRFMGFKLT